MFEEQGLDFCLALLERADSIRLQMKVFFLLMDLCQYEDNITPPGFVRASLTSHASMVGYLKTALETDIDNPKTQDLRLCALRLIEELPSLKR